VNDKSLLAQGAAFLFPPVDRKDAF